MTKKLMFVVALVSATCWHSVVSAQSQGSVPDPLVEYREQAIKRWEDDIVKLEELDKQQKDPPHAILFIGSSSIRRWTELDADLAPRRTINRGYGGAKFSDLAVYAERLVQPHRCAAIVIFVGNDIVGKADDKTPAEVARLFQYVVDQIRKSHATPPVFLIAITPTPSRFNAWPQIKQANAALEKICELDDSLYFIATESKYLDDQGQPIPKYFVEDRLHQNREGYAVWSQLVKAKLDAVMPPKN